MSKKAVSKDKESSKGTNKSNGHNGTKTEEKAPVAKEPKKKQLKVEDFMVADKEQEMEDEKDDAIGKAINQFGAGKLSKKQKEEVAEKAKILLAPPDQDAACMVHLKDILHLAARYHANLGVNSQYTKEIRVYRSDILGLMNKPTHQRAELAKRHTPALRGMYKQFKTQILDLDLAWLDCGTIEDTKNPPI